MNWFSKKKDYISPIQLTRSEKFITAYEIWRSSTKKLEQIILIQKKWNDYLLTNKNQKDFVVLDTPYSKGIVFSLGKEFGQDEGKYLIDYFKENLLEEGYYLYQSLQSQKNKDILQSHYTKPKIDFLGSKPHDQKYGNILLELVSSKGKEKMIKIQSNYYNDRNYKPALVFEELIEKIL